MKSLFKEKTLVLAIIVQLLIASFSSLLVIGLASFFDPTALDKYNERSANVGIVGNGELNEFIRKSQVKPFYYNDVSNALDDFYTGKIDAIVVIPAQSSDGFEIIRVMVYLPKSDIMGMLVTLQLKKPLEEYETYVREVRASRINFEPTKLYVETIPKKTSTYFEFIYGILIPLLVFTPVFISGGLIIDMITEEFERKTFDLLMVTPASFMEILNGKMLVAVLIVPLQAFIWLVLISMNGVTVENIWIILLLVSLVAALVVAIGAIIAVTYKKRLISQYMYSLLLILMFLVGYLISNSPFNLVTRLSSGSIGVEALTFCGIYAVLVGGLYAYIKGVKISEYLRLFIIFWLRT